MEYTLRHFDTPLLRFAAKADSADPEYQITWVNEEQKHLLPLDFEATSSGIDRWIRHRTIPKNRAFVHDFLAKCGLHLNRPMNIVAVCKGLSLNDCYWVTEADSGEQFERVYRGEDMDAVMAAEQKEKPAEAPEAPAVEEAKEIE